MAGKRKAPEGGNEEERTFAENAKRSYVEIRRRKAEHKAKLGRSLTADQISVVSIELDLPGQGRISLRPSGGGGLGNSWDADLTDAKVDRDPTDQFFDMDGADGINDMDPSDPIRRGGSGGPIIIA